MEAGKRLERINELARKQRTEGLTGEEKIEQAQLRKEYIAVIRENMRANLNNISIVEEDGSITHLGQKFGRMKKE